MTIDRKDRGAPPSIQVFLSWGEWDELEAYLARHGGKKGPAARAALLEKVREDNYIHQEHA